MKMDLDFVINSIEGNVLQRGNVAVVDGVSTDSRSVEPGQVFFALVGENNDGHDFLESAIISGAAAVVVSRSVVLTVDQTITVIMVKDTLVALQELAAKYRQLFDIPIVAVTGSVGKTTTKDLLASCLEPVYNTLKTPGNYNNEIGLPLTLLTLNEHHQAAVLELAMRAPGEIRQLAAIVKPTYAIITNVEPVHLETLGSLENIAQAKCELLEHIQPEKFALINGDNELLKRTAQNCQAKLYYFGFSSDCDIQILGCQLIGTGMDVKLRIFEFEEDFYLPVPAPRLATNLASAVGAAYLMGVKLELIKQSLYKFQTSANRLKIVDLVGGGVLINDTYNANPVSMSAALEVCSEIANGRRKVAVLGDMLELGDFEKDGHLQVGRKAADIKLDLLVTVGERAAYIGQGALFGGMNPDQITFFGNRQQCLVWLKQNVNQGDVVLFKASRGMRLELLAQRWLSGED